MPQELRDRCKTAWRSAVQLDELLQLVGSAVASAEGLVLVDLTNEGKAPLIEEVGKLASAVDRSIEVARELEKLLHEVGDARLSQEEKQA
jgi:hypothetical protein